MTQILLVLLWLPAAGGGGGGGVGMNRSLEQSQQRDQQAVPAPKVEVQDAGPALTQAEIVSTLQARRAQMQSCYEAEWSKNHALAGKVIASFTIQPTGAVSDVALKESTLKNAPAEKCILAQVALLQFSPKPATPIGLAYGWTFQTQAGVSPR